jgi:cyclopropane fatty-acyl-phospholipid synthase-like methyltransferase
VNEQQEGNRSVYARAWDAYVRDSAAYAGKAWPGDEWASPEAWEKTFERLFLPAKVSTWQRALEIGPGSGKYTLKVLNNSLSTVRAYDVSPEFLKVCERRCKSFIDERRLSLCLLDTANSASMLSDLESVDWKRRVDAVYSIDAMVHVDLQHLIVYLLTAALVLAPGGRLILTLADPTTPLGFMKLLEDIPSTFPLQNGPSYKFEWVSQDIVRLVLLRLGFVIDHLYNDQRDLFLVARLSQTDVAENFCRYLRGQNCP